MRCGVDVRIEQRAAGVSGLMAGIVDDEQRASVSERLLVLVVEAVAVDDDERAVRHEIEGREQVAPIRMARIEPGIRDAVGREPRRKGGREAADERGFAVRYRANTARAPGSA